MKQKRIISSFLLFVFLIVFAHSVIPHHHHFNADDHTSEHNSFQADDAHEDFDTNFLGKAFSLFQHEPGGVVIHHTITESQFSKLNIESETVFFIQYQPGVFYKPPLKHTAYYSWHSPHNCSVSCKLLRAPPVTALA